MLLSQVLLLMERVLYRKLQSGASIKYTTQKWLTPKGKWINEKGVIPDEIIEQGDKYGANPTYANDVQLQKAVEILKK